jgi:hypothetical protein
MNWAVSGPNVSLSCTNSWFAIAKSSMNKPATVSAMNITGANENIP